MGERVGLHGVCLWTRTVPRPTLSYVGESSRNMCRPFEKFHSRKTLVLTFLLSQETWGSTNASHLPISTLSASLVSKFGLLAAGQENGYGGEGGGVIFAPPPSLVDWTLLDVALDVCTYKELRGVCYSEARSRRC